MEVKPSFPGKNRERQEASDTIEIMKAKLTLITCFYIAFFILSPPFQLPDEPDHFQYVYLLSRGSYPRLIPNAQTPGNQPLLKLLENTFDYTKVASRDYALPDYRKISTFSRQGVKSTSLPVARPALSKQGHQPPLYHLAAAILFKAADFLNADIITQFYLVRLTSAVFYFLSLWLVYRICSLYLKRQSSAQNLTVFFALNPLVLKAGVTINPDIALLFFSLLFLYTVAQAQRARKEASPLVLALVAGAAVLSKFAGIFLVPFYLCLLFFRRQSGISFLRSALLFSLGTLAVILPWLLFNLRAYRSPVIDNFALMCKQDLPRYTLPQAVFQAALEFRHTIMHYAGFWGWGEPYPFKPFFIFYAALFVFLTGTGLSVIVAGRKRSFYLLIGLTACLFLFLFPVSLRHKLLRFSCDIQGRYILPVFPAIALAAFAGLSKLVRDHEETAAKAMFWFAVFQANLVLWYVIIPKYYV